MILANVSLSSSAAAGDAGWEAQGWEAAPNLVSIRPGSLRLLWLVGWLEGFALRRSLYSQERVCARHQQKRVKKSTVLQREQLANTQREE